MVTKSKAIKIVGVFTLVSLVLIFIRSHLKIPHMEFALEFSDKQKPGTRSSAEVVRNISEKNKNRISTNEHHRNMYLNSVENASTANSNNSIHSNYSIHSVLSERGYQSYKGSIIKLYSINPQNSDGYTVPNIVHYVWFTKTRQHMLFTEMVSVLSAWKNQKPDTILLHCNYEPSGPWWEELQLSVKNMQVIHREMPVRVGSRMVESVYHAVDIAKLEVLLQYGGMALDLDVFVLNSLNPLRKYDMTMGREKTARLNAGTVIASKHSQFLRKWYLKYVEEYRPSSPDYNCCTLPFNLAKVYHSWIHIEDTSLTTPDWIDKHLLFIVSDATILLDWRQFYTIHMMFRNKENRIYNPEYIKPLRNLVGKVLRLIYYGVENELSDYAPWVYYSKHPLVGNVTEKPKVNGSV